MTTNRTPVNAAFAVVAFALIAVLGAGIFGGHQITEQTETFEFVVEDHSVGEGVVLETAERGGFEVFGVTFSQPQRFVRVAFTLPSHCAIEDALEWPTGQSGCAGPDGLTGTIAGSGITAIGGPIVLVETSIDAACFGRIELGATWPPAACTS